MQGMNEEFKFTFKLRVLERHDTALRQANGAEGGKMEKTERRDKSDGGESYRPGGPGGY